MKDILTFKKWEPFEGIPKRMFCEAIHDDYEGFRILLRGESFNSPILRISFDAVLAYQNIDEGNLLRTIDSIKDLEIFPLYKVYNSSWLKWFHEENYGINTDRDIDQYAIFTPNDCINVLSEFEPNLKWLS